MSPRYYTPSERITRSIVIDGKGCWIWQLSKTHNGYGRVRIDGRMLRAHRASYEINVGKIPEGMTIEHRCRTRDCVNPDHLLPCSIKENILRGTSFAAENLGKTHCVNGHLLEGENLYVSPLGCRHCIFCTRASQRRYRERQAAHV